MDKPYFIVNPVSGSGLAAQKFYEGQAFEI